MGRSKNNKNANTSLGQVKKESREERRKRILAEVEARERCFRILPQSGAVLFLLTIAFCIWVRSVPKSAPILQQQHNQQQPPFMQPPPEQNKVDAANRNIHSSNILGNENEKRNSPKIAPTKVSDRDKGDDITIEL